MPTHLIITFTAKPEKLAAFTEIMHGVKTGLPQAEGCLGVQIYNSASDPCVFTLVETWQSEELHQAHIDRVVRAGDWQRIASHLAREPVSGYYRAF